jgi:hypothetical protein
MPDEETDVSEVAQQCEEIEGTNDAHPALEKMEGVAAMDAGNDASVVPCVGSTRGPLAPGERLADGNRELM